MATCDCVVRYPTAVTVSKCSHAGEFKGISSYPSSFRLIDMFKDCHPALEKGFSVKAVGSNGFELDWDLTVADIASFNLKSINFKCNDQDTLKNSGEARNVFCDGLILTSAGGSNEVCEVTFVLIRAK
ncbi:hypothetical protein BaRGS_00017951 [Batillaria attramentaria]|uniref:Uncharacterized protein n=1 Tax=Batillaria attramentaria TaxID=370345 RepID=A0ABD0KVC5_9CAEN